MSTPDAVGQRRPRGRDLVMLGLAAGLLTGLGETVLLLVKRFLRGRFITVGEHALWMAPVADALLFTLLAIIFVALTRRVSVERRDRLFATMLVALGLTAMLTLWGRFHWVATILLSLGIAVRLSGRIAPRLDALMRAGRAAMPGMAVLVLLTAAGVAGEAWWKERKSLEATPAGSQPNVLLIILDTVRSLSMGLYGHARDNTPELARWAARGTVFDHAFSSSSWTLPSHAAMFTGRWQTDLTVRFNRPLDSTWPTLAEFLGDRGYATGGFVANLIYTPRESGLARGFGHYEDFGLNVRVFIRSATLLRKLVDRPRFRWAARPRHPMLWKTAREVSGGALDWIDRQEEDRPWFAFLNYMEAHDPWYVPAPFDTLYGNGALHISWAEMTATPLPPPVALVRFAEGYDAAIAYLDQEIGSLLDTLERRGRLRNTIVVITSDHGEEIGEHQFLGHGASLYRPTVEVPLIVIAPGCAMSGGRAPDPVSLRDFAATIMDLTGMPEHPFPGASFAALACPGNDTQAYPRPVFSVLQEARGRANPTLVSVVQDSFRFIGDGQGRGELYSFYGDPLEQHDLAAQPMLGPALLRLQTLADSLRKPH